MPIPLHHYGVCCHFKGDSGLPVDATCFVLDAYPDHKILQIWAVSRQGKDVIRNIAQDQLINFRVAVMPARSWRFAEHSTLAMQTRADAHDILLHLLETLH